MKQPRRLSAPAATKGAGDVTLAPRMSDPSGSLTMRVLQGAVARGQSGLASTASLWAPLESRPSSPTSDLLLLRGAVAADERRKQLVVEAQVAASEAAAQAGGHAAGQHPVEATQPLRQP